MQQRRLPAPSEAALRIAEQPERHRQSVLAILRVGSESLAVETRAIQEITLMARLSTPAGLPTVLAGFLNVAERAIPVIRLHRLLHLPEPIYGLYTQIVILRNADESLVGWIVDRVAHVVTVPEAEIMAVPANHAFNDCTTGVFTYEGTPVSIVAPGRVLLEKERQCIDQFRAMEQERLRELEPSLT